MNLVLMEEHLQAYYAWKAQGVRGAWCWHVDAHLDIGKTGLDQARLERVKSSRSSRELALEGGLGSSYLPWGGLHCGNYLYPAIQEGIVGRLSWVVPPDLPEANLLSWARQHINSWYDLSLCEYAGLSMEGERVVGTIMGIPFEMGTLEALALPDEEVLLDVDLDYFLTEAGELWLESHDFFDRIDGLQSLLTTVAYSVKGGFTPDELRRLDAPFVERAGDARSLADCRHELSKIDELAALVRCRRYQEALALVGEGAGIEERYLLGTSLHSLGRKVEAEQVWLELLREEGLARDGKAYLHGLLSELYMEFQAPKKALEHALAAQSFDGFDYRHSWNEAVAREALGESRKATKIVRQVLKATEHLLFGLKVRYALARLYQAQGKDGLFRLEMQKLAQLDVTGQFRAQTMLYC